jgi:uncharacterized protein (UPF0335 family)
MMSGMAKQTPKQYNVATMQPDEVNALRSLVKEFINRVSSVDNEIEQLKEDRKELIEEYTDKLDMKTLTAALKILKIQQGVQHRDTFDLFMSALEDPAL